MEVNGKVYRNLEGQVGYLTEKYDDLQNQINDVRAHLTHYVEVDTLPTGDDIDPSAVYLLGPMGTAPDQYYEEWVYVQKADESWMWEKLGDTDSVDLSGYLEKQTGTTTNPQAYVKNADGTQGMADISENATGNTIAQRFNGQLSVPLAPTSNEHATSKKYVDDGFLAKQTGSTSYDQVYVKYGNGTQGMMNASNAARANMLAIRDTNSQLDLPDQSQYAPSTDQSISKRYADGQYLAKQTGTTTYRQLYGKYTDGTQAMFDVGDAVDSNLVVRRNGAGQINVPTTPTDNAHAASKAYVDAAVGQLLYLHEIDLRYTISASITLGIKCYLVNGDSTAITSLTRAIFKRITASYGALNPYAVDTNACAITKMPDTFRQDEFDEPNASFLYQYYSGGSLTSGNTFGITPTVTDVVVSF